MPEQRNTPAMSNATAATPCIKVCVIDPVDGLCTGCLRTRNEIALWGSLSNAERLRIMATLPARRKPGA